MRADTSELRGNYMTLPRLLNSSPSYLEQRQGEVDGMQTPDFPSLPSKSVSMCGGLVKLSVADWRKLSVAD